MGNSVRYNVIMSSGRRVEAIRNYWGLDVMLYAPKDDSNSTEGFCGDFDGDPDNDFGQDQDSFGARWRVKANASYFDILPDETDEGDKGMACFCHFQDKKITEDCLETAQIFKNFGGGWGKEVTDKKDLERRSVQKIEYSDDIIEHEERSFFVDTNDLKHARIRIRSRRSISSQMSKENATQYCNSIIKESMAGKLCSQITGMELSKITENCIVDLEITGDKAFAGSAFASMKDECEDLALKNLSLFTNDASGNLQPPREIGDNLCPNDCSGLGNCTNRTCICLDGYTGADCSLSKALVPELFGIYDGGLCDIRRRPCKKTDIFGDGFIGSENLTCHSTEFKVYGDYWVPSPTPYRLPGEKIDIFGVKCDLPDPPTKLNDYNNPGTPAGGLHIKISNNKIDTSDRHLKFISYDSVCLKCNKTGTCVLREDSCIIDGHCFAPNAPNPRDWCEQCLPKKTQFTWSGREDNNAPKFTTPQTRFALLGEDLPLQIQATDKDNRPITYSLASTNVQGYTFTSRGLLNYTMTSSESKAFTVVATDECGANDTITITLKALQCPCNEGLCHPHPYHPRGSGQYYCTCPVGFTGNRCEKNIDDCHSAECVNGSCIDGVNNYTCLCSVGFKGRLCDERVYKCANDSCFPGVNCTEVPGSVKCGACPAGLSGDGKTCLASTSTSAATTTAPPTTAPPTTTKEPTTDASTSTSAATTAAPPTTTKEPTTDASTSTSAATTTAPATTTPPTTAPPTTSPPTTTKEPQTDVTAEIRLKMTWKMELSDKMSKEFKDLAKRLKGQIAGAFKENKDFISATILSFRKGSIVARFSLLFSKNDKQPLDDLKKKIKGGKLGSIDVDPESLKRLDVKQGDTASENDLPNFVIYLVIAGSVVVLVIVIALLILVCGPKYKYIVNRKKKGKGTEFNMESYGYNNPEYSEFPENKNREEKQ